MLALRCSCVFVVFVCFCLVSGFYFQCLAIHIMSHQGLLTSILQGQCEVHTDSQRADGFACLFGRLWPGLGPLWFGCVIFFSSLHENSMRMYIGKKRAGESQGALEEEKKDDLERQYFWKTRALETLERATRAEKKRCKKGVLWRAEGAPFFTLFDRFGRPGPADRCLKDTFSADLGFLCTAAAAGKQSVRRSFWPSWALTGPGAAARQSLGDVFGSPGL